jgi:hypothetical protein
MQRFIAWWIRNAGYIGPVATAISALAATASVVLTRRTFLQSKRDRQEELESRRPKFIVDGQLLLTEGNPDYYILNLTLNNIAEHSASFLKATVKISHDAAYKPALTSDKAPLEEIHRGYPFEIFTDLVGLDPSDKPYYLRLELDYKDSRTWEKYNDVFERKLSIPIEGMPSSLPVWELDFPERAKLHEARRKRLDEDWENTTRDFMKFLSQRGLVDNSPGRK